MAEPKSRSRAGGHFYLDLADEAEEEDPASVPVYNIAQIIRNVMASAADAEIGALFVNSRFAIPARQLLKEMEQPQPPTQIQKDDTTALGCVTKKCNQRPPSPRK